MEFCEQNREVRIAAGCSLGCSFCTLGEGREGLNPDDVVSGRVKVEEGTKYMVLAGDLIDRKFIALVKKLKASGAGEIEFYAHSGATDPSALKDLADAGLTGIHLVLPSAEKVTLGELTHGRGQLKTAALLLATARELGLAVTLEIPVVGRNAGQTADTVRRVQNLVPLQRVILNFVSESTRTGEQIRWDPATAATSVEQTIRFCVDNDIDFRFGRNEAPPPCILPLNDVPVDTWGDLAGSPMESGNIEVKHPYEECGVCQARGVCRFTGRHLAPVGDPKPLTLNTDDPQGKQWVDAAAIWVRRNDLRTLRQQLAIKHPRCLNPWTNLETHSVRGVAICCATHRFQYGTVDKCVSWHDQTLLQSWNSQVMQSIRHHMNINDPHVHCRPDCVVFHGGGPEDSWLTSDPRTDVFHANLMINLQEILDGAEVLESRPQNLVIAPSLKCNIACVMCRFPGEVRDAPNESMTKMSDRQYDEVIEMMPYLRVLNITGGEPLIADGTRRLLRAFHSDRFLDGGIAITTNALLLDPSLISDMKKSRLLSIIISINAADAQTYQYVTGVNGYDKVIRNVEALMDARKSFNPIPRVVLSFVIMKCNWRQIPDHIKTAARLGTDIQLLPMVGALGNESMFTNKQELTELASFVEREVVPLVAGMRTNYRREVATLMSTIRRRIADDDYSVF